jgi:cytidine deaminase
VRPIDPETDAHLIEAARDAIRRNYDVLSENHTVGAAVRCRNGRVYVGINVHCIHGSCAEFTALGSALTAGERDFETLVCVRGADGAEVLAPCGNCRQMLSHYAPGCDVIVPADDGLRKATVGELLPFAYRVD